MSHTKTLFLILLVVGVLGAATWGTYFLSMKKNSPENHGDSQPSLASPQMALGESNPEITPNVSATPSKRTREIGGIIGQAARGDSEAEKELMQIAADDQQKSIDRQMAIRFLAKSSKFEPVEVVINQLLSTDPGVRTAAFYGLPVGLRPPGFDYTAMPSNSSKKIVDEMIAKIRK